MNYPGALLQQWFSVLILSLIIFPSVMAQKSLDHDAYDIWNRINSQSISPDGKWILYSAGPENGDVELTIMHTTQDKKYHIPNGDSAAFSYDSRFVISLIRPTKAVVRQAKLAKKKPGQMPKDSLAIISLSDGKLAYTARIKSYRQPQEKGGWAAYLLEKPETDKQSDKDTADDKTKESEEKKEIETDQQKEKKKKKPQGSELVLRYLPNGRETTFTGVVDYYFSKDGRWLVFSRSTKEGGTDGVYAVVVETGEQIKVIQGKGNYKQLTIDDAGNQTAFLSNRDDYDSEHPQFILYYWPMDSQKPQAIAKLGAPGIPDKWLVSEHGKLWFSEDGKSLFFGTNPPPYPEADEKIPEDEKVVLDIWHWKDPYVQPMQLKNLKKELKRSYLAVVHLNKKNIVQLASEMIPDVKPGKKGNASVALGVSNIPYRQLISWEYPPYYDIYLIDTRTGKQRLVIEKVQSNVKLSPNASYLSWWDRDEQSWYALNVRTHTKINLTPNFSVPLYNEIHDWPYKANPYGSPGWTEKDALFLVYDKHDLWAVDPSGKHPPLNITEGMGRKENIRFRYIQLDPEARFIMPDSPMLLSSFNYQTKARGFYRDQVTGLLDPQRLVMADKTYSKPTKAKESQQALFTRSDVTEFPDLWVSSLNFKDMRRLTDLNPQQSEYLWATVELVEWASLDGQSLQGLLYKPENFDASRKYPLMVYFYEKNSDNLHKHWLQTPHRSIINPTFYASRGYLVFVPDVTYKIGYPGESAMNSVIPGVTQLIKQGFVDEANIGVQGHSWGGYQIAYLVTRSNLFKAAEAGAPVSNMTSAYGGIRWGSGLSRMFQYEQTQSRIGGSLWEYPLRYIENSPVFWADKIETPLLILHNDHDGAVPWYQGIELFVALRRLGKPVWMLNYNNEPHWPKKYHNKRDFQIRLSQFFDHYLKGMPAPVWLKEGIPAIRKGKTLGLEPAEEK